MEIGWQWIVRVSLVGASALALPAVSYAQVNVIISGGFAAAYQELLPEFERTTGIKVSTASGSSLGTGPNSISGQLRSGIVADVVILSKEGFSELVADRKVIAGSETDLAQSPLGIAVRSGAPKTDVSSMESLRSV